LKQGRLIHDYIPLLSKIISNLEKIFLDTSKRTLSVSKKISLNSFLLRAFLFQILLLTAFTVMLIGYSYLAWKKQSNTEVANIEQLITTNLKHYTEVVEILEQKLKTAGIDIKSTLDANKYNKLLHFQEGYINISDIYLFNKDNDDGNTIYSRFGQESFAVLPPLDFITSLKSNDNRFTYCGDNFLFLGKSFKTPNNENDSFIILKVDLEDFIESISTQLNLSGEFLVKNTNTDNINQKFQNNYFINARSSLTLEYIPQDFNEIIRNKIRMILVIFLLFLTCSSIWITALRSFFKNIINSFNLEQAETKEQNIVLKQEKIKLLDCKKNLEASLISNREFYNILLSYYGNAIFDNMNVDPVQRKKGFIGISKIIIDCRSILYPELHKNQIECSIEVSAEKDLSIENSTSLYILLLNYLYKAIYKTPKNGKISISAYKEGKDTLIRITDNGFNLKVRNDAINRSFLLFTLSDALLEKLAADFNIKIVKTSLEQANIVELKVIDKVHPKPKPLTKYDHGNVIHFPTND
jgi:hypothetical protein